MIQVFSKKAAALVLILLFVIYFIFITGCNRQVSGTSGKPTLEIGIQQHMNVLDYKNNYLTKYLEDLYDIELVFNLLPPTSADLRTKLSLMMASNGLPETIWTPALTREQILEYGENGAFISLNNYFADAAKTPYFNMIPEEIRTRILKSVASPNGHNYSFARYNPFVPTQINYRLFVNHSWLNKLGLEVPRTTDELREVLLAFRDGDPNGNGRKDEIGVVGRFLGGEDIITALINAFIFYNPDQLGLNETGDRVIAPFAEPAFRQALQYLNGLFKEGLLDASTFTMDQQTFRAVLNASPMVVGFTTFAGIANFPDKDNNNSNFWAFMPMIPPLSSPISPGYTPYQEYQPDNISYITNKARNRDLAVKVMDSFYEPTLSIVTSWGEEDVDWTRDPSLLSGISNAFVELGLYPSITFGLLQRVWTTPQSKQWMDFAPRYTSVENGSIQELMGNLMSPFNPDDLGDIIPGQLVLDYLPRLPEHILPRLNHNSRDGARLIQPITNVNGYVRESIAGFVIGTRDINNDTVWNTYLRELDNMGLREWLRIAQETYDKQR